MQFLATTNAINCTFTVNFVILFENTMYKPYLLPILLFILSATPSSLFAGKPTQTELNFFEQKIKPILTNHCYECHSAKAEIPQANLWLDRKAGWEKGGDTPGPVIIPGKPEKSLLIQVVKHQLGPKRAMPRDKTKLSASQIKLLEQWIKMGAPDNRLDPLPTIKKTFNFKERLKHWAFQKPIAVKTPSVKQTNWPTNKIDYFTLNAMEKHGLKPAAKADKRNLLRRLSFALTGLPPSAEEVKKFQNDHTASAYKKQVDRLLNSKHFGERWARHWMDLVRYSETKGHEFDFELTNAYLYRDYLIRSFNKDVPYDQFVREHIAGDMIKNPRRRENGNNESILGTGFFRFGDGTHSPVDVRQNALEKMDNMIDVTSRTFNAMTVSCARCHDHKFDAISQEDYFGMYGIMESSRKTVAAINTQGLNQQISKIAKAKTNLRKLIAEQWLRDIPERLKPSDKSHSQHENIETLVDFSLPGAQGWYIDGQAFTKNLKSNTSFFFKDKKIQLRQAGAYSDTYAKKLTGSLRSPTMKIPANFITIKASGKNSSIRIIMENFQVIRAPIYGNLFKNINNPEMAYHTFDLRPWKKLYDPEKGKVIRIYIEAQPGKFINTAVLFGQSDDAFIGIAEIYAHDKPINFNQKSQKASSR